MCYIFYVLALVIGFFFPASIASSSMDFGLNIFYDLISLLVVIVGSFFLVATASGTLLFYKEDKYLEMWGDLGLKMGYIGTLIGFVLVLGGMAMPPETGILPVAQLGGSLAVAILTLLYGLMFKYMVIAPWLGCRRK
mgnify:CR=1 FL=1